MHTRQDAPVRTTNKSAPVGRRFAALILIRNLACLADTLLQVPEAYAKRFRLGLAGREKIIFSQSREPLNRFRDNLTGVSFRFRIDNRPDPTRLESVPIECGKRYRPARLALKRFSKPTLSYMRQRLAAPSHPTMHGLARQAPQILSCM
jgi:hypothetical protein